MQFILHTFLGKNHNYSSTGSTLPPARNIEWIKNLETLKKYELEVYILANPIAFFS